MPCLSTIYCNEKLPEFHAIEDGPIQVPTLYDGVIPYQSLAVPSEIGLFANRQFEKDEIVCELYGPYLDNYHYGLMKQNNASIQAKRLSNGLYMLKGRVIEPYFPGGAYTIDAHYKSCDSVLTYIDNNCYWKEIYDEHVEEIRVFIVANRPIEVFEEIHVCWCNLQ